MAWSNIGNLKGPKGDAGEVSGGIPQGAIVLAYNKTPTYEALRESDEWIESGSFIVGVSNPPYDSNGKPAPNSSGQRRFVLFAKS